MKEFRKGQIVKSLVSNQYLEIGKLAEVQSLPSSKELVLVFCSNKVLQYPCSETSPKFFDFYEKVRYD